MSGRPIDREALRDMSSVIRHRGPDGEGQWVENEVGLAHRRLSIIDLEGGRQPMDNEDGRLQLVFNGEIYNFLELRQELEVRGHQFKTKSDTEVIIHAYEQWGTACLHRFNGMFAFALWDGRRRELLLARDHLGIKPLYYVTLGRRLLFSSEIKSLLLNADCPREVDLEALAELFTFRYVPSPKTMLSGIMKLPPAHYLVASESGLKVERFWNRVPRLRSKWVEADLIEEYQVLVEDAVRMQMRSDVPVGLFLSSGVDSGALLSVMSTLSSKPVQCFTIGFEGGERTNEVAEARTLAKRFGAEHHSQTLRPEDYMSYFHRYLWDLEEPVGNETAAALYFLSRVTREKVKVALSGQGVDEPWAGYDRYKGVKLSDVCSRLPRSLTQPVMALLGRLPGRLEQIRRGAESLSEPDTLTRFSKVYSFFNAEMKSQLYRGELGARHLNDAYAPRQALGRLQQDVAHLDPLTQMLYIDTRASLPDDLLMVADKTSMANSLECRVPFLDYRLVEFIESLPPSLKLNRLRGKYLHKQAARKWLPDEVVYRRKKGFANPVEHWFRVKMRGFVDDCLLSGESRTRCYFDERYIRELLQSDRNGTGQYRRHIFLLVSFELWCRNFLTKPSVLRRGASSISVAA